MEKKELHISLIIQIICSALAVAAVLYSHNREDMPYSGINDIAEYVIFYNADISAGVDKIKAYAEKLEFYINKYIPQREAAGGDYHN